jgi:hypothetical protein
MNAADTVSLVQRMNRAGFQLKDHTCGVWRIMRGDTTYGQCSSLDGVEGWFACWNSWVPKHTHPGISRPDLDEEPPP